MRSSAEILTLRAEELSGMHPSSSIGASRAVRLPLDRPSIRRAGQTPPHAVSTQRPVLLEELCARRSAQRRCPRQLVTIGMSRQCDCPQQRRSNRRGLVNRPTSERRALASRRADLTPRPALRGGRRVNSRRTLSGGENTSVQTEAWDETSDLLQTKLPTGSLSHERIYATASVVSESPARLAVRRICGRPIRGWS